MISVKPLAGIASLVVSIATLVYQSLGPEVFHRRGSWRVVLIVIIGLVAGIWGADYVDLAYSAHDPIGLKAARGIMTVGLLCIVWGTGRLMHASLQPSEKEKRLDAALDRLEGAYPPGKLGDMRRLADLKREREFILDNGPPGALERNEADMEEIRNKWSNIKGA